ncbi:MAG: FtsQ-type POTRA domain-containing protein [Desulfarculaceae bacterium]|nr:FtsQ-type POTRA domain-containing protein [Desulfarculaceae bacterium]MCF8070910.1 FtsQ-type POTRA domain-containing protein [Desulfarculaceae bacterium]MCF8100498.1 FtsQ-type POTRA domain-containing protein [Desulfarculaceae bacterium]MCF8116524.1 FtsQ-type POTRA domain-containing protein [Desulfarculaceae bacterium]
MFKRRAKKPALAAKPRRTQACKASLDGQRVAKRRPRVKRDKPLNTAARSLARTLAWGLCVTLLVSAALLTGWGLLSTSRALTVHRAEVTGTDHLSRLDVLRAAEVGAHSNLLALPVGDIAQRVRSLPWVSEASVRRQLPGTVIIEVSERHPALLALVEGRIYYLDRELRPISMHTKRVLPDLPVVTGLSRADLAEPDEETLGLLAAARAALAALPPGQQKPGGGLAEIHLDRVWGVSLVFNGLAPVVRLGFKDFPRRLTRLASVRADLARRGELGRARLIDLESHNRVVVRLGREKA